MSTKAEAKPTVETMLAELAECTQKNTVAIAALIDLLVKLNQRLTLNRTFTADQQIVAAGGVWKKNVGLRPVYWAVAVVGSVVGQAPGPVNVYEDESVGKPFCSLFDRGTTIFPARSESIKVTNDGLYSAAVTIIGLGDESFAITPGK